MKIIGFIVMVVSGIALAIMFPWLVLAFLVWAGYDLSK